MKNIFNNWAFHGLLALACLAVGYFIGYDRGFKDGEKSIHQLMNKIYDDLKERVK